MSAQRPARRLSSLWEPGITILFGVSTGAFAASHWLVGLTAFVSMLLMVRAAQR